MSNDQRRLLGYVVKKWEKGVVKSERTFPPTAEGKRAAERLRSSRKTRKPGRPGQAVTVTPIFEVTP